MNKTEILETVCDAVGLFALCALAGCCEEWFGAPAERTLLTTVLWQLMRLKSKVDGEGKR